MRKRARRRRDARIKKFFTCLGANQGECKTLVPRSVWDGTREGIEPGGMQYCRSCLSILEERKAEIMKKKHPGFVERARQGVRPSGRKDYRNPYEKEVHRITHDRRRRPG